jgi:hypothetical protein
MASFTPNAFEGPRRMYLWKHVPGGGYYNQSALIYRYDRKNGVQAQWTPSVDYAQEIELPEALEDEAILEIPKDKPEIVNL